MVRTKNPYICCFGEVLWDLLPTGKLMGGAPMNVSAHLQQLGVPSVMISRIGKDDLGIEIMSWLNSKNFPSAYVQVDELHSTGSVNVDLTDKNHAVYEIVQPAAWDFIALNEDLLELAENAMAIVFGSLACRHEISRNTLSKLLDKSKLKIFDVNLRPPYYSQELIESLLRRTDIAKMNDDELRIISSWNGLEEQSDAEKMSRLKELFNLQMLLVTRGKDGAILLNDYGFYEIAGHKITVADTIGSGDSFLAGFLKKYIEGKSMPEVLNYACAIGALVATHHGAIPFIREEEILKMMQRKEA